MKYGFTDRRTDLRLYSIYRGMKFRCYNPNSIKYPLYGGKGVRICEEWLDNFDNFYAWAMSNGYKDNLTIDRLDSDGDYTPSNCRWATYYEQNIKLRTPSTGVKGVYKMGNNKNCYYGRVYINRHNVYTKGCDSVEEAVERRNELLASLKASND